jgi:hypothetical protein
MPLECPRNNQINYGIKIATEHQMRSEGLISVSSAHSSDSRQIVQYKRRIQSQQRWLFYVNSLLILHSSILTTYQEKANFL